MCLLRPHPTVCDLAKLSLLLPCDTRDLDTRGRTLVQCIGLIPGIRVTAPGAQYVLVLSPETQGE